MKDRQWSQRELSKIDGPAREGLQARTRVNQSAFSLVEVVLALGVISFAIVAILGILPIGLQTSHSSQDETRAAQIAQTVLAGMASQAQTSFTGVKLPVSSGTGPSVDLTSPSTTQLYATNDGQLSQSATGATYNVAVITDSNVVSDGFDPNFANKVIVQVRWPTDPNPGATPSPNQTYRDFVRFISKY